MHRSTGVPNDGPRVVIVTCYHIARGLTIAIYDSISSITNASMYHTMYVFT